MGLRQPTKNPEEKKKSLSETEGKEKIGSHGMSCQYEAGGTGGTMGDLSIKMGISSDELGGGGKSG